MSGPKCVGGITWPKHAHAQSLFWAVETDLWHTRIIHFDYTLEQSGSPWKPMKKEKQDRRNGSYHRAQVIWRQRKIEEQKRNGFYLALICI